MVELLPSKQVARVRFPSPAPYPKNRRNSLFFLGLGFEIPVFTWYHEYR